MPSFSIKPSKQRRLLYRMPKHRVGRWASAPLSEELRSRYGRRSYPLRKGDTVKIVRGDFAGIQGKITDLDRAKRRVFVEGVSREKVAGTSVNVSVHSSKVVITRLNLDDKWRAQSLKVTETKPATEGAA